MISVTSDLVSDNRVHKVSNTLTGMGFRVLLIGRKLPGSLKVEERNYSTMRFRLPFKKGPLFYACFNVRLFFFLLFSKFDILLSNDLDTLPANFLISRLRRKPLVYDSHEYFTEVPELVNRPLIKRIWEMLEKVMIPHVSEAYTVCNSIAAIYSQKYKRPFHVVRNFPNASGADNRSLPDTEESIILYQGAVNVGRGLRQAIRAMSFIEGARLVIVGDGDIRDELEELVLREGLTGKVTFLGRLPMEELSAITHQAAVGLSVEEDIGLNYRYALPNKLFDYIQARVPVLVTNLPEMAAIVRKYEVGEIVDELAPQTLADVLKEMIHNKQKRILWKENLGKAARELVWEKEEIIIRRIFSRYI